MIRPLFWKAVRDARALFIALAILLVAFNCLFVWISSTMKIDGMAPLLKMVLPEYSEKMIGLPIFAMATRAGIIASAYVHPVVVFSLLVWSLARGSDAVSGEIGRGTMEILLAQPIRRTTLLATQAIVTSAGALLLAAAIFVGTWLGLMIVPLDEVVEVKPFAFGAANLFAHAFFLGAIATMISSADSARWRTIGLVGGFYVISLVLKIVSQLVPGLDWVGYLSFLTAVDPHILILSPERAWELSLWRNGVLLGLGAAAYAVAVWIFNRRDLPAPL